MPFLTPLQRIRKTLAESGLERGVNGAPTVIELVDDEGRPELDHRGEPVVKKAVRNPLVALIGQDVVAVCDEILIREPENQKIKDLRMGCRRAVNGRAEHVEVLIQVDDAWQVAEIGREPVPEEEEVAATPPSHEEESPSPPRS